MRKTERYLSYDLNSGSNKEPVCDYLSRAKCWGEVGESTEWELQKFSLQKPLKLIYILCER